MRTLLLALALAASTARAGERLEVSPDGRFVATGERSARLTVMTRDGAPVLSRTLTSPPVEMRFSPDGAWLAVSLWAGGLIIVPTQGGSDRSIEASGSCRELAWAKGRLFYVLEASDPSSAAEIKSAAPVAGRADSVYKGRPKEGEGEALRGTGRPIPAAGPAAPAAPPQRRPQHGNKP